MSCCLNVFLEIFDDVNFHAFPPNALFPYLEMSSLYGCLYHCLINFQAIITQMNTVPVPNGSSLTCHDTSAPVAAHVHVHVWLGVLTEISLEVH